MEYHQGPEWNTKPAVELAASTATPVPIALSESKPKETTDKAQQPHQHQ